MCTENGAGPTRDELDFEFSEEQNRGVVLDADRRV